MKKRHSMTCYHVTGLAEALLILAEGFRDRRTRHWIPADNPAEEDDDEFGVLLAAEPPEMDEDGGVTLLEVTLACSPKALERYNYPGMAQQWMVPAVALTAIGYSTTLLHAPISESQIEQEIARLVETLRRSGESEEEIERLVVESREYLRRWGLEREVNES